MYAYAGNNPVDLVDPSGLNASSVSYFCYDIVTYGHYTNDPDHVYAHTETFCSVFGGGGGSAGDSHGEPSGGGGGGGNHSKNKQNDKCSQRILARFPDPPTPSNEEMAAFRRPEGAAIGFVAGAIVGGIVGALAGNSGNNADLTKAKKLLRARAESTAKAHPQAAFYDVYTRARNSMIENCRLGLITDPSSGFPDKVGPQRHQGNVFRFNDLNLDG